MKHEQYLNTKQNINKIWIIYWTYSEIHFNRFWHKSVESTKKSSFEIRNSNFDNKLFRARVRISSTGWTNFKTVSFSASEIFLLILIKICHENCQKLFSMFLKNKLFCRNCFVLLEIAQPRKCHATSILWKETLVSTGKEWRKKSDQQVSFVLVRQKQKKVIKEKIYGKTMVL